MHVQPIGFIRSCFKEKFGTPRQSLLVPKARARIELLPSVQPEISLEGLEGFSHLWVIFWFHQNTNDGFNAKVSPPKLEGERKGVFATRTPHRPNPLGLSLVEIVKLGDGYVEVSGGDFIEGTPVLDLKPYLPHVEAIPQARSGWAGEVRHPDYRVTFSEKAESELNSWAAERAEPGLRQTIIDLLTLDPRPLVYKNNQFTAKSYKSAYGILFYDRDIRFVYPSPLECHVTEIVEGSSGR